MPNQVITAHARLKPKEENQGDLLDFDPLISAEAAYEKALHFLFENKIISPEEIDAETRAFFKQRLKTISQNFWQDQDFDARTTDADIKRDIKSLIAPLQTVVKELKSHHDFVQQIIGSEVLKQLQNVKNDSKKVYQDCINYNSALLKAVKSLTDKKYKHRGSAVRYKNASASLIDLWSDITGKEFRRTRKLLEAHDRKKQVGLNREFSYPEENFVWEVLMSIRQGHVPINRVHEGIKAAGENRTRARKKSPR